MKSSEKAEFLAERISANMRRVDDDFDAFLLALREYRLAYHPETIEESRLVSMMDNMTPGKRMFEEEKENMS